MKTRAICAKSFAKSVQTAAGVKPRTSPDLTLATFKPAMIENCKLLYIKLHGLPNQPFWYGDDMITAMSAKQIRAANLHETVVYVANCELWQDQPGDPNKTAPMLLALLAAGASAVVGGAGENYARSDTPFGADHLGQLFVKWSKLRFTPATAFFLAKKQFKAQTSRMRRSDSLTKRERLAIEDTLGFRIFNQTN